MEKRFISFNKDISILVGLLVLAGLYLVSLYSYLLFHSLAEIFSIVVAFAIFMLAWNARHFLDNNYLLFVGVTYLFVAMLDILHTLAYKGMGVFPGYGANLPTQLWIAGRYCQSISLLIAPLFLGRKLKVYWVFIGYVMAVSLLLASVFYYPVFPDCYIEGAGLTSFKKVSEYIISLIFLVAIALLLRRRQDFNRDVLRLLVLSIIFMIAAELAFTFYISVYDFSNLVGHFFKIISFYLIYKALVQTGLVKPHNILFRNLKQSEARLRQYTAELQARNEELDAFAHTVAHDLKNPLTHIITAAELLKECNPPLSAEEQQEILRAITQMAFKMNDIIRELLMLAQVRQEEIPVEPLDMATIVAEVRQHLADMIEEHRSEMVVPGVWPTALGYGPWIEAVWTNYLSNAIKYGGQPPRLELGATVQADGMIRFWVRDNGPGIRPEDQARLFDPFTRLDPTQVTGYGLGLSIVRRIVEKLGGQVGVESEGIPGRGSLFFFTLPAVPDQTIIKATEPEEIRPILQLAGVIDH